MQYKVFIPNFEVVVEAKSAMEALAMGGDLYDEYVATFPQFNELVVQELKSK